MTFKHVKFEDSPIMRSLEKVAQEKGLVKPQPLNKTAAAPKKTDLTPTTSLMDNVLKLCAGLRERGFEKQANELEVNLINYKQAQTLYETHKETGEDLVHAAHPKGSHKLEGVDADEAVFEDILDQMTKSIEMVNKRPTGKLSSATAITNVKQVLAQDTEKKNPEVGPDVSAVPNDQLERMINGLMSKSLNTLDRIGEIAKGDLTFASDFESKLQTWKKTFQDTSIDGLKEALSSTNALEGRLDPHSGFHYTFGFGLSGLTEQNWTVVSAMIDNVKKYINEAIRYRTEILTRTVGHIKNEDTGETEPKPIAGPSAQLIQKYNDAVQKIGLYKARLQGKDLPNGATLIGWLDNQALPYAQKNLDEYSKSQYKDDAGVTSNYSNKLNALTTRLDAFQQKWSI